MARPKILRLAGGLLAAAFLIHADKVADSPAGEKWELQYSFEQPGYLTITDLKFWSPQRGMASGFIEKRVGNALLGDRIKETPVVLVTNDSGRSWVEVAVKDRPLSLFVLGDSLGWLVASEGLWMTNEAGRSWRRISTVKNLLHVYFLSATHGFAAGTGDQALETSNGGATWSPIVIEGSVKTVRKIGSELSFIAFGNSQEGLIGGSIPEASNLEFTGKKHSHSFFTTTNGGKSWRQSVTAMKGQATGASFLADGNGLVVLQFSNAYGWPSEVFAARLNDDSDNHLVYRDLRRVITDVLVISTDSAYLAGYENPGKAHPSPIPGKVRIVQGNDLEHWTDMPVDYRAVANRVILASPAPEAVWAATDTGFILHLRNAVTH